MTAAAAAAWLQLFELVKCGKDKASQGADLAEH